MHDANGKMMQNIAKCKCKYAIFMQLTQNAEVQMEKWKTSLKLTPASLTDILRNTNNGGGLTLPENFAQRIYQQVT